MNIFIDILLVAVVVAVVIVSAKKGLIITVLEIIAFVAAIFLAGQCAAPVASVAYSTLFESTVLRELEDTLPENPKSITYLQKAEYALNSIPDFAKQYASSAGIDVEVVKEKIVTSDFNNNEKLYVSIEREIVRPIAVSVLKTIMFLVLSVLFGIILRVIAKSFNRFVKKSKLLGPANAILGGAVGVFKGLIFVFLLCCLLTYIQPKITNETIRNGISDSSIVQTAEKFDPIEMVSTAVLYNNNNK